MVASTSTSVHTAMASIEHEEVLVGTVGTVVIVLLGILSSLLTALEARNASKSSLPPSSRISKSLNQLPSDSPPPLLSSALSMPSHPSPRTVIQDEVSVDENISKVRAKGLQGQRRDSRKREGHVRRESQKSSNQSTFDDWHQRYTTDRELCLFYNGGKGWPEASPAWVIHDGILFRLRF